MSDLNYINLNTGKRYAYGKIVGMSLDPDDSIIYTGFDDELGQHGDVELTKEEKIEVAGMMAARWLRYIEELRK